MTSSFRNTPHASITKRWEDTQGPLPKLAHNPDSLPRNNCAVLTITQTHSLGRVFTSLPSSAHNSRHPAGSCHSSFKTQDPSSVIQAYTWTHLLLRNVPSLASSVNETKRLPFFLNFERTFSIISPSFKPITDFQKAAVFQLKIL